MTKLTLIAFDTSSLHVEFTLLGPVGGANELFFPLPVLLYSFPYFWLLGLGSWGGRRLRLRLFLTELALFVLLRLHMSMADQNL